jgi:hypothetical protein
MTIAASGAISLTDLQTEFGGPTPIALQNYYRGGTYVTDVAQNAAVPTSGAISLLSFYGTTREVVSILDVTVSDDQPSPTTATASYSLRSDGFVAHKGISTGALWVTPGGGAPNYECQATVTSGSLSSGTAGSWLPLTSTQTWSRVSGAINNTFTVIFTLDIRRASDHVVVATATITLKATKYT